MEITSKSEWKDIDWKSAEQKVFKLQKRIYRASENGNVELIHKLQKILVKSWSARLLAVRKVTQENKGRKTAGIDGVKTLNPKQRLELVETLKLDQNSRPLRRIWIPKPGKKENRPLGIPTMEDRAKQALLKMALEPEWEANFEENSYGFRPGRGTYDALKAIRTNIQFKPKYVLDADISKCFDNINHEKLLKKLKTTTIFRKQIKVWLRSRVINDDILKATKTGTPQGGICSPLLANIALHGMEKLLSNRFPASKSGYIRGSKAKYGRNVSIPRLIRYADDYVITCEDLTILLECKKLIEEWLNELGLRTNPDKTRIVHTLYEHEGNKPGFDFLGFTIRQYKVGKRHQSKLKSRNWEKSKPYVTIFQPSKKSIANHYNKISQIIHKHRANSQEALIKALIPVIRGWCNYFSLENSSDAFRKMEYLIYKRLRRWAYRRNRMKKTGGWIAKRYWIQIGRVKWNFACKNSSGEIIKLPHYWEFINTNSHTKVKGAASPYNGDDLYWTNRIGEKYKNSEPQKARLIKKPRKAVGKPLASTIADFKSAMCRVNRKPWI